MKTLNINNDIKKEAMINIITIEKDSDLYPESFKAIGSNAPERIYALGNTELLKKNKTVAIIGSRRATRDGNDVAYKLGKKYANDDYVVVSGLALGCDASAHRGCLDVRGKTIAIVATGLDMVYPRANAPLQQRILNNNGLVISEQPPDTRVIPANLVARDRLQAALSDIVVVAECPEHSGTMHTVRFAKSYGKEVRAVNYDVHTEANSGNNKIISQGIGTIQKL